MKILLIGNGFDLVHKIAKDLIECNKKTLNHIINAPKLIHITLRGK